jgi:fructokinase
VATSGIGVNDLPTGVARVTLDAAGSPDFEIATPAAYEIAELPDRPELTGGGSVDLVVFGTLAQRFPGVRSATQVIGDAAGDAPRLYDVNLRPGCWSPGLVSELMGSASVVKMNADELAMLAPELGLATSSIERFARAACDRFTLRGVCVTRGASGAALLLDDVYREAPAPRVEVIDTVGAGDAFAAGVGYGLVQSWTVSEILSVATRLGALVASRAGAIPAWNRAEVGLPR